MNSSNLSVLTLALVNQRVLKESSVKAGIWNMKQLTVSYRFYSGEYLSVGELLRVKGLTNVFPV